MGIKIKNLQTGEFEKFNIPALKGEKGEPGEIEPSEKVDYIGKQHSKLRDTMNANVDYIIKTAIGEFNYLDYEGQHITATNSIEGHARSAILSGQTLVNVESIKSSSDFNNLSANAIISNDGWITISADGQYNNAFVKMNSMIKPSTKYLIIAEIKTNTLNEKFAPFTKWTYSDGTKQTCFSTVGLSAIEGGTTGIFKSVVTTYDDITECTVLDRSYVNIGATSGSITYRTMLIEYQEGMENWDIPYFEGMQSVKMPVLKTTGKNLWSGENITIGKYVDAEGNITNAETDFLSDFIEVKPNTTYAFKVMDSRATKPYGVKSLYDKNKKFISRGNGVHQNNVPFTTPSNCHYVRIHGNGYKECGNTIPDCMLIETTSNPSTITTHEPYKSNILHTPEEVVLRSLPNGVKDTLNLNTGEYVQHIKEVVFDGSSDESIGMVNVNDTTLVRFNINNVAGVQKGNANKVLCSSLPYLYIHDLSGGSATVSQECISNHSIDANVINIVIKRSRLSSVDVAGFRAYLQSNPITIQYPIATPNVKTVDLSDNHVYSYKGTTHYSCSSEEGSLVPTLSVKVPTDTQLTIQEQKATTQTLLIKNMDLQQSIKEVQAMNLAFNTALYNSFNSIREEVEDIKKHVSTNENLEGSF